MGFAQPVPPLMLFSLLNFLFHRQCRCIFRDQLNLARLEDQLLQLLSCAVENIDGWLASEVPEDDEASAKAQNDTWSLYEKEKLFCAVVKVFQLHFPFYQARKIHVLNKVSGWSVESSYGETRLTLKWHYDENFV